MERRKKLGASDITPQTSVTNTRTESSGSPITVVSNNTPPASDTTVYHDGKIKRQNSSATDFAEFIYYDEKGGKHNLGKSAYIPAKKLAKGNVVITGKGKGTVYLVDQREHTSYKNGSIGYKWTIDSEHKRYYLNGVTLAAVLGAMMNFGYQEFVGSGWSNRKGQSVGGSSSHRNGNHGDFRYLGKNNIHRKKAVWTTHKTFDMAENTRWVKKLKMLAKSLSLFLLL